MMREINECTVEVFRRSEKRMKARRRNRNRILAFCIPVCLVLTVFSFTTLSGMFSVSSDNAAEVYNNLSVEDSAENIVCSYTEVEIQDVGQFPDHYEKITDKVKVTNIFLAVHSLFPGKGPTDYNGMMPDEESENMYGQPSASSKRSGYQIAFSGEDGSQTVYILAGNLLRNQNTNETVSLTEDQVIALKEVLGLSE